MNQNSTRSLVLVDLTIPLLRAGWGLFPLLACVAFVVAVAAAARQTGVGFWSLASMLIAFGLVYCSRSVSRIDALENGTVRFELPFWREEVLLSQVKSVTLHDTWTSGACLVAVRGTGTSLPRFYAFAFGYPLMPGRNEGLKILSAMFKLNIC